MTSISTPNIPICKFQYQRMFDHCRDHHLSDHYANMSTGVKHQRMFDHCAGHHLPDHYGNMSTAVKHQRMFDHCADHHLPDHYGNMGTAVKVLRSLMHNVVISIHVILKCTEYQINPHVKCIGHCICQSIVKLLYIEKGKREVGKLGTEELRCTSLCTTTKHIELYVCMVSLLLF